MSPPTAVHSCALRATSDYAPTDRLCPNRRNSTPTPSARGNWFVDSDGLVQRICSRLGRWHRPFSRIFHPPFGDGRIFRANVYAQPPSPGRLRHLASSTRATHRIEHEVASVRPGNDVISGQVLGKHRRVFEGVHVPSSTVLAHGVGPDVCPDFVLTQRSRCLPVHPVRALQIWYLGRPRTHARAPQWIERRRCAFAEHKHELVAVDVCTFAHKRRVPLLENHGVIHSEASITEHEGMLETRQCSAAVDSVAYYPDHDATILHDPMEAFCNGLTVEREAFVVA